FIIQPTNPPADNYLELLLLMDAARRASAARITAVLPYFGYARQDRKDQPRVAISAKLMANLITHAGADRVLGMDFHSHQVQGFFDIPVDHLYAAPVFVNHYRTKQLYQPVVVAPDVGSAKMARGFATHRAASRTPAPSSVSAGGRRARRRIGEDGAGVREATRCVARDHRQAAPVGEYRRGAERRRRSRGQGLPHSRRHDRHGGNDFGGRRGAQA